MSEAQDKPFYKIGEVCELTGTQPYVLRFWESEFPGLAPKKNRTGQRVYRQRDIELIKRIKTLLYDDEYTIPGARKILDSEDGLLESEGDDTSSRTTAEPGPEPREAGSDAVKRTDPETLGPASPAAVRRAGLPFEATRTTESHFEAEVRNLRAKLSHVESELRSILEDMDRREKLS